MGHCVYVIENLLDGKKYVGYTHDAATRWYEHKVSSRRKRRGMYIHRAIAKHGIENFTFTVVQECVSETEGLQAETKWIARLNTQSTGYNQTSGGDGCRRTWTEEQRLAKSAQMKGRKLSDETRAKLSEANKRRWAKPGAKDQQADRMREIFTEEVRAKLSEVMIGKKKSPETRRRMSEARKARNNHPATE